MKDYTKNNGLCFGNDKIKDLELGEVIIPARQYEFQNREGEDKIVSTKGEILAITKDCRLQMIAFKREGQDKVSLLYCNGAEGCFKDWLDGNLSNKELKDWLEEDDANDEEFIKQCIKFNKQKLLGPLFEKVC